MNRRIWSVDFISSNQIFAGTDSGAFSSSDGGRTWISENNGLTDLYVNSIILSPNGYKYAATSSGVFRSNQPLTDVKSKNHGVLEKFTLYQNFPNPFNPTTAIGYDVPVRAHVTLVVYDILGRRVETLVDAERQPGHYEVTFDASALPSGVYLCMIQVESFSETKKLLYLK